MFNQSAKELLRFCEISECRRRELHRYYHKFEPERLIDAQYEFHGAYRLFGHKVIIEGQLNTITGEIAFLIFCAKEGAEKASDAMLPERGADATYH